MAELQSAPDYAHAAVNLKWYRGLERYAWVVLTIAALGWMFDTMDQNIFTLVRAPSLRSLLYGHHLHTDPVLGEAPNRADRTLDEAKADLANDVKSKGGTVTSLFLIGWSVGGFLFGMLGDRLGRTRTMIITILLYALFTGASGLATNWQTYAAARFLTALGVGGEWAAGAALVAEVFPMRSRAMALGSLQSLGAVGNIAAALITLVLSLLVVGGLEAHWRVAYFVGAAPALLVLWIARSVHEPEKWQQAKRDAAAGHKEMGSIAGLFRDPVLRRNTIAATLMATAGVGSLWGVSYFSTDLLRERLSSVLAGSGSKRAIDLRVSSMFLALQFGAMLGTYCFAAVAERLGRRKTFFICFGAAWLSVLAFFWGVAKSGSSPFAVAMAVSPVMGFFTLGPFAGYTVFFPELFPTRLRSTGCGFCYNAARVLAAAAPFVLGNLATRTGGFAPAATIVSSIYVLGFIGTMMAPETKGLDLPDDTAK